MPQDLSLVDWDAEIKSFSRMHVNTDDTMVVENVQDTTDIIEANKEVYNDTDERARYGDMARVASLPLSVYFDLWNQGIIQDDKRFMKWLDDPANLYFRTMPGKLSR